ncbi:MAG: alpha/beta hydrolase [Dehalococcoidia bacterium]|nr:alpha/beta hydrolase [Dehalococcoidia bacterium]
MGRPGWSWLAIPVLALLLAACSDNPPPLRERADGAATVVLATEDGLRLDARLWVTSPSRVAIYLHEYREDQTSWWTYARQPRNPAISALTIDFRGHGESQGEADDIAGMLLDVDAAISYVREAGYQHITLVGAGMGGALAIVAAAGHPEISVAGLSVPSEFNVVTALTVAPLLESRLALAASRDDLSAAYSLEEFQQAVDLGPGHVALYPGRAHGVDMLKGRAGADVRAYLDGVLATFGRQARSASR